MRVYCLTIVGVLVIAAAATWAYVPLSADAVNKLLRPWQTARDALMVSAPARQPHELVGADEPPGSEDESQTAPLPTSDPLADAEDVAGPLPAGAEALTDVTAAGELDQQTTSAADDQLTHGDPSTDPSMVPGAPGDPFISDTTGESGTGPTVTVSSSSGGGGGGGSPSGAAGFGGGGGGGGSAAAAPVSSGAQDATSGRGASTPNTSSGDRRGVAKRPHDGGSKPPGGGGELPGSQGRAFPIFDGMEFFDKPGLSHVDLQPIEVVYFSALFPHSHRDRTDELPPESHIRALAHKFNTNVVVSLNFEPWPLRSDDAEGRPLAKINEDNVEKIITILKWFNSENPDLIIGLFGIFPRMTNRGAKRGPGFPLFDRDADFNDEMSRLAAHVDVIMPSLFTGKTEPELAAYGKRGLIAEAKQYGKPVYVWITPQYRVHKPVFGGNYIPVEDWKRELALYYKLADGVILRGGANYRWRGDLPWWPATKQFVRQVRAAELGTFD